MHTPQSILESTLARGRAAGITQRVAREIGQDGKTLTLEPDGQMVTSFASCSYLGLDRDWRLAEASIEAIRSCGVSVSASRSFYTSALYPQAEELLARVFRRPVVLAGSTTLAHGAAAPLLFQPGDVVLYDRMVHHSVQVALASLGRRGPRVEMVRHADLDALESATRTALAGGADKVWYCADGVYSMFGDRLDCDGLAALMQRYPALHAYLDDAHGMSWCGERGAGSVLDAALPADRTVVATSLSKGFGASGGALAVPDLATKRRLEDLGPSLMFSIQLPPASLGAICASARLHLEPELGAMQRQLAGQLYNLRAQLAAISELATRTPATRGAATPIGYLVLGETDRALAAASRLLQRGLLLNPVAFPAVPLGRAGLRYTVTRAHDAADLTNLVAALAAVLSELGPSGVSESRGAPFTEPREVRAG